MVSVQFLSVNIAVCSEINEQLPQHSLIFNLFTSLNFKMGISIHCRWLAALLCALLMGIEVQCACTENNLQIEGGYYTLSKNLMTGSMVVYRCHDEGHYPYPHLTRTCQPNGAWAPPPRRFTPQRCRMVECPDPNVLEYGNVNPPQTRYFVDNETTYECYSGYTLRGSARRVCLNNGKWSGSTPICSRDSGDHCADPGIPPGTSRTGHMFGIDDTVRYTCNNNLLMVGSSERVCQENGQWTGEEPACYYKHTFDTPQEISKAFGATIKQTLTTLESTNDTQAGRKIWISKNGTLNIYIGVDISDSIDEISVNKSRDAVVKLIKKISSFSVTPNYEVIFFSNEIYEIVSILDVFDGKLKQNTIEQKLNNFTVGDKNAGTNLNIVFETFWERMGIIKVRVGEERFKEHRHVLILFTDGAYNMGGSPAPTVAKIKNTVYMNQEDKRKEYLDIYVFAIGEEISHDELESLTAGTGGRHYFKVNDLDKLHETFDEMIHEDEVKGLCGLHKEYTKTRGDFTDDQKKKMYPWLASVHTKTGDQVKNCLGSLVTPEFVLTAAHCIDGYLPADVSVEIDDGFGKRKKVKAIYKHGDYNVNAKSDAGIKEFYDYDVALIQLEQHVDISTKARPICLPCTLETQAALKLVDETTCKAQEQLLLKNQRERLNFLTAKSTIHLKDAYAKLGDNRYECIRHAINVQGITEENLMEAVTDNFICTGGRDFREHIACTGDSGGAVFKNFEHRTIQIALVSWGTKQLCKSGSLKESDSDSRDFHLNLFRVIPFLRSVLEKDVDDYAPLQFLNN